MVVKVLFFTYYYPPIPAPRSIQIGRLAKYSRHAITVVCAGEAGKGDTTIPAGAPVLVRRVAARPPDTLPGALACLPLVPDRFLSWCRRAGGQIMRQGLPAGQEVLVTFGQPMSVHLAGLRLKRATGIPWLAHFSDPWADSPYRFRLPLLRRFNRWLEARVVAAADRLLFTCTETRDLVMGNHPAAFAAKAGVLPHAYDPDLFPPGAGKGEGSDRRLVIRHVGAFYRQRTPDAFLEALLLLARQRPRVIERVRVEFVGRMHSRLDLDAVRAALPPGSLTIRSRVDYAVSLRLMRQADLLLLIDAPFARNVFLPSKLIDYLGAGRPILALTPPGATAGFVGRLGGVVVDPSSPARIAAALEEALALARRQPAVPFGDPAVRQEYRAEEVAARFDRLLAELAGREGR